MSSDIAIRIEGLGKAYRIAHQEQQITLAEQALERLRHPFRRATSDTLWALKDVDLEVERGEVLGLIGRNGAGKSTLLKVLSRITPPTTGRVELFGRIGSLLEVGTGFHPELTGRENIYLNGSILGMKKPEIDRQFADIVEFAGVERFLDTPVKRYSSGMYVRLAFAVAAHLETEILLIDEVLAVGDQDFQDKCIGKMHDVSTQGRTVIVVSHNLASVRRLAERCVLLDQGTVSIAGQVEDVLQAYEGIADEVWTPKSVVRVNGTFVAAAEMARVALVSGSTAVCGEPILFDIDAIVNAEHATELVVGVTLRAAGSPIGASVDRVPLATEGPQQCTIRVTLPTDLLARGRYTITLFVGAVTERDVPTADHVVQDVLAVDLATAGSDDWLARNWDGRYGSVRLETNSVLRVPTKTDHP